MAEDRPISAAGDHVCPWCSATLPDPTPDYCPACAANLAGQAVADVPGVTTIDPEVVRRAAIPAPRRRFLGFLVDTDGEAAHDEVEASSPEALAPPSDEVRAEMQRLRAELDAAAAAEHAATLAAAGLDPAVPRSSSLSPAEEHTSPAIPAPSPDGQDQKHAAS